jgi:type I restriction enzyme M protein
VWVYDLRTNMPSFGKRTPLTRAHFAEFEAAFGEDCYGRSPREDQRAGGRFRRFIREEIRKRGDNLDLSWLRDESAGRHEELPEPEEIAAEITARLQKALAEMEELTALLAGGEAEVA